MIGGQRNGEREEDRPPSHREHAEVKRLAPRRTSLPNAEHETPNPKPQTIFSTIIVRSSESEAGSWVKRRTSA